jgi:hypothetical protein
MVSKRAKYAGALVAIASLAAIGAFAGRFVHGTHVISTVRAIIGDSAESARLPSVEDTFPGWHVTAFHHPIFEPASKGLVVKGGRDPAGVFFRTELDPASVFRLAVDGVPRESSPVVRLRFDGGPAVWRTLDPGRTTLVLPQARSLEALVYADGPYTFELRSLAVERCDDCMTEAARARTFPGWEVTPYLSAPVPAPYPRELQVLWSGDEGVQLRGSGSASGVLLTRRLDAAVTYRLLLHGTRRNAAPALRVRLDDRPFIWRTIDRGDGDLNLVLPKAERLEALLYSDAPYAFDLHGLTVEPCSDCITDEVLKTRIISEAEIGFADPPLDLARKLRDWVARTVVFGEKSTTVGITTNAVMSEPAWQSYVDFFAPHRGGVWCAGIARYYQEILALFDFPSATVDIGYEGTDLTHVTTLVVVKEGDARRFYIFDPTFSGAYVGRGGYIDVEGLLSGKPARFQMDSLTRTVLMPTAAVPAFLSDADAAQSHATCGASLSLSAVSECRVENHNRYNMVAMRRAMTRQGLGPKQDFVMSLLRHRVVAIHASAVDPRAADDLRRRLARFGVPVSSIN